MLVAAASPVAVGEPEVAEPVGAFEENVQFFRGAEVDVKVDEEAAQCRVLLERVGGVGAGNAIVVWEDAALARADGIGQNIPHDQVAEAGCAHHVTQDPRVDQLQPLFLVGGPAESHGAAVDIVEKQVEAARRDGRQAPLLHSLARTQQAAEVEHVRRQALRVDCEHLAFGADLDLDDALESLRHVGDVVECGSKETMRRCR